MSTVLVVEDEASLLRALEINLRARAYAVLTAPTGLRALEVAAAASPDLVLLDLGLPDLSGLDVIRGLRRWTEVPILVLSGRDGSTSKVEALDAGADDYVTKPFGIEELLARLRAAGRRAHATTSRAAVVAVGDVRVDLVRRQVCGADGREIRLTPTEWALLDQLVRFPGKLRSGPQLVEQVWGQEPTRATGVLRVHMANLRRKVEADPARPRHLLTEPGLGYRFVP